MSVVSLFYPGLSLDLPLLPLFSFTFFFFHYFKHTERERRKERRDKDAGHGSNGKSRERKRKREIKSFTSEEKEREQNSDRWNTRVLKYTYTCQLNFYTYFVSLSFQRCFVPTLSLFRFALVAYIHLPSIFPTKSARRIEYLASRSSRQPLHASLHIFSPL